jgi:hypothetical protein
MLRVIADAFGRRSYIMNFRVATDRGRLWLVRLMTSTCCMCADMQQYSALIWLLLRVGGRWAWLAVWQW